MFSARKTLPRSVNAYRFVEAKAVKPSLESIMVFHGGGSGKPLLVSMLPKYVLYCAYYVFIVSLPFESAGVSVGGVFLSQLLGMVLAAAALCQHRMFSRPPPKAFWWFVAYVSVNATISLLILTDSQGSAFEREIISQLFTLCQLLVLFWISYNLMMSAPIMTRTLLAFGASCILLAILQVIGITGTGEEGKRISDFGANPNAVASVLSLGLLAVIGLAYGRRARNTKIRALALLSGSVLLVAIVQTGSRGGMLALVMAIIVLAFRPVNIKEKLRVGIASVLLVGSMIWVSYRMDFVRERWALTYYEGHTAGRGRILQAAWQMFLDRPIIGWGPVHQYYELGARVGWVKRDAHNLYLWLLIETGLIGAIPFFVGLWLCCRSAWRARATVHGTIPLALMLFLLGLNLSGTWMKDKLFWVALSYTLASGSFVLSPAKTRWKRYHSGAKLHRRRIGAAKSFS